MRETPAPQRETTLRDFVAVVFRRRGILITLIMAAVFGLVWINARTPTTFLSTARLLVNRGEPESVYNSRYKLLSWEEDVNSEIEVLRSTILGDRAQKILKETGAVDSRGDPVSFKPDRVATTTSGKASVLIVTYTGNDPVETQEALRALTRAYIDWRATERDLPIVDGFFQEELESLRDRLSEWEQRRADFMTEEGIVDIPGERQSLLRQREDASKLLADARMRVSDFSARLDAVRSIQQERLVNPAVQISGIDDAEYADDPLLDNLRRELADRRTQYFEKQGRYTENHPEVLATKEVVDRLEIEFDQELLNYARLLEARVEVAQAKVRSLDATVRGLDEESLGLPDKEARLNQYERIIEALKKDYTTLVDRQITAKVETTGKPEWRVILLQPATQAIRERTRDYVRFTLVPIFALLIGLALAFVIDGLDHSLKDAAEAEEHLGVPVLGSLSRIQ
jgi:polysaccharide biosynthesis transport protein